tara:strand:+ start:443 stop:676 length:234 start_codon:yes stop_codon:yes gene_type:complete
MGVPIIKININVNVNIIIYNLFRLKYNIAIIGKMKNALSINKRRNQLSPFFSMKIAPHLSQLSFISKYPRKIFPFEQ